MMHTQQDKENALSSGSERWVRMIGAVVALLVGVASAGAAQDKTITVIVDSTQSTVKIVMPGIDTIRAVERMNEKPDWFVRRIKPSDGAGYQALAFDMTLTRMVLALRGVKDRCGVRIVIADKPDRYQGGAVPSDVAKALEALRKKLWPLPSGQDGTGEHVDQRPSAAVKVILIVKG
jgi:hypothetical protein